MFSGKPKGYVGNTAGFVNPVAPTQALEIANVFGPRPFSPHIGSTGYDYDFHRGVDFPPAAEGNPHYAATGGVVLRQNYTHYHWNSTAQLSRFTETDINSTASANVSGGSCTITVLGTGTGTFPSDAARWKVNQQSIFHGQDDWFIEVNTTSWPAIAGEAGIAVFVSGLDAWVSIGHDGTDLITSVRPSGGSASDSTFTLAAPNWIRVVYTQSSDELSWEHSSDGDNWTSVRTVTGSSFDSVLFPTFYWLSGTASGSSTWIQNQFNYVDETQTVGRFGNWVTIGRTDGKIVQVHMSEVLIEQGAQVDAGQKIGTIGKTGVNARSGRINSVHVHLEWSENTTSFYDQDEALNPLNAGLLPRANVNNNISGVVTEENDPDGTACWRVTVTVTRNDADFDLDYISFVGSSATRTIAFNARTGLNADNDIPVNDGVYIVPEDFDENSSGYICSFYFAKATVGAGAYTITIKDTVGTTVDTI